MRKSSPPKSPTPKPPYMHPHRNLAIEAMIVAVIMRNDGGVSPIRKLPNGNKWLDIANADEYETSVVVICHEVERALSWATREEIHKAIYRMAPNHRRPEMHRILPKAHPTRAIPLYVFG